MNKIFSFFTEELLSEINWDLTIIFETQRAFQKSSDRGSE